MERRLPFDGITAGAEPVTVSPTDAAPLSEAARQLHAAAAARLPHCEGARVGPGRKGRRQGRTVVAVGARKTRVCHWSYGRRNFKHLCEGFNSDPGGVLRLPLHSLSRVLMTAARRDNHGTPRVSELPY